MRDYREKLIDGMIFLPNDTSGFPIPVDAKVIVRMTSDANGQSLSLNAGKIMIAIPLESVSDIIKVAEKG